MADGQRAVLDRVVDDVHAVLLVGADETEQIVPRSLLPEGASEGTWLRVRFEGERLVFAVIDEETTARTAERIASKLALLRQRGGRLRRVETPPEDGPAPPPGTSTG